MSLSRVSFFMFLAFAGIAMQFAVCENIDNECGSNITYGSDCTKLQPFEKAAVNMMKFTPKFPNMPKFPKIPKIGGEKCSIFGKVIEKLKKLEKLTGAKLGIAPGTRWCGAGDIARGKEDLGLFKKTDACCKAHDECNCNIEAGNTKCNLKNDGLFTRSHCKCDEAFFHCLKNADCKIGKAIQCTYFNFLQPQCFRCEIPKDSCPEGDADCIGHCDKYEWVDSLKSPIKSCLTLKT